MKIAIKPGKYVLAVSGGVDSMSLMHLLSKRPEQEVIIAHFNHGIRGDSYLDEKLVKEVSHSYGLEIAIGYGNLGQASEDQARQHRYRFLNDVKEKTKADGIITAHHQDDMIETAFINIMRGTGRRGLSSIIDSDVIRPLLPFSKDEIIKYAINNHLQWREDSSNGDSRFLRNYLRLKIIGNLLAKEKELLVNNLDKIAKNNIVIDREIAILSRYIDKAGKIDRSKFALLPLEIGRETVIEKLRNMDYRQFDRKTVDRLTLAIRSGRPGTEQPVNNSHSLRIGPKYAHFTTTD